MKLENLLKNLKKISIKFSKEVDENGQLYGTISKREIQNFLADKEIKLQADDIQINEPIKSIGEHIIDVNPYQDLSEKIKVIITRS